MKGTTMTFLVKYKRRIVAAAVILCVLVLGINWKASISFAVETHEKILVGTEECLTKAVGALKAAFAQEQEVAPEEDNFYTLFSQQLVEKGSYRAYVLMRILDCEGDRSYEFSISVSSSASGIQLSQGQEKTREVWKDGTYYQIDEANGAVVQTSTTEVYRDPLNQACAGKLVAERTIRQEGRSSTQYEIYNTGAVYCMTFDADGRLTHLESFRDDVWTEYDEDFSVFYERYLRDRKEYGGREMKPSKPYEGENLFNVSCIPWASFTGFGLNVPKSTRFFSPIFTVGKYYLREGKLYMPFAAQVHHAVCDGWHVAAFVNGLQERMNDFLKK